MVWLKGLTAFTNNAGFSVLPMVQYLIMLKCNCPKYCFLKYYFYLQTLFPQMMTDFMFLILYVKLQTTSWFLLKKKYWWINTIYLKRPLKFFCSHWPLTACSHYMEFDVFLLIFFKTQISTLPLETVSDFFCHLQRFVGLWKECTIAFNREV